MTPKWSNILTSIYFANKIMHAYHASRAASSATQRRATSAPLAHISQTMQRPRVSTVHHILHPMLGPRSSATACAQKGISDVQLIEIFGGDSSIAYGPARDDAQAKTSQSLSTFLLTRTDQQRSSMYCPRLRSTAPTSVLVVSLVCDCMPHDLHLTKDALWSPATGCGS